MRPSSLVRPAGSTKQLTPEQRREVKKLWKKRLNVWQISEAMKVEPYLVYGLVSTL